MKTLRALEKITAFRMLDHYKRLQLVLLLARASKGVAFSGLKAEMGLESNDLVYHVKSLEKSHLVQKKRTDETTSQHRDESLLDHPKGSSYSNLAGKSHYELTTFGREILGELGISDTQTIESLLAEIKEGKYRLAYE